MNHQKHIRNGLASVSFCMTGLFGFSLASGFTALLFAISMILIQAGALLYMPERFIEAKDKDSGIAMSLYGGAVITALLLSVTASVATLSGSYDKAATAITERETLQTAIDGYIEAGYITKALSVKSQLEALPELEVTPLASAANRIEAITGVSGYTLVTGFITSLALMLDLFVILLTSNTVTPVTSVVTGYEEQSETIVTSVAPMVSPEVKAVLSAMDNGVIKKPTVREVRDLLRCSQAEAMNIARTCKQLELSFSTMS